ncbi:putative peptide methionine sulfoxide reductase [Trypanosoma cruzi]|uniref:peptide-methionine (S)-S-oxide reductase n=2 Tax=Trypanosoma cruzi TaxID=5693 RepID=Q4DK88_TRYCC|nr:peptide methionine sulfoxide reductase, putative [Trypanosoma cruzi]EAN92955.1 peptide methionine sulfoxide reductase, putative [Trypanosoma cruzi]PWV01225.1 putative peptide methionine sulfoxide reductase [Trypanosoma cruzi]RNC48946.1 peptide methionine sulfoxide reductase [Trypanosoma cruzi]|eukprot:XP_814806.1 peptide methionine sulfoxide reductase [Trypanosoma cruzi strain CL Brener]
MASGAPATFAAGCFWGTERFFVKKFGDALLSHEVGYMGGAESDEVVTYSAVKKGTTGHAEVLHVKYNPEKVTYQQLLDFFFRIHNPTTVNRQGVDVGTQYRSAIFYHDDQQLKEAKDYISRLNGADPALREGFVKAFGDAQVATSLEKASRLHVAEDYHQMYLKKNPDRVCSHRIHW